MIESMHMNSNDIIFKDRKVSPEKLPQYYFEKTEDGYVRAFSMLEGQLCMRAYISANGKVHTKVIDSVSGEEYILHRVPGASGAFVGRVKEAYQQILQEIADKCFVPDVFKSDYARKIITYALEAYGDEPEFLWKRFPENAVLRRKDNGKWYAALLRLSGSKLGLATSETIEILDLRIRPEEIETTVDNKRFFPGYHMNKQHWYTICLDGSVPLEEIYVRLDASCHLAKK